MGTDYKKTKINYRPDLDIEKKYNIEGEYQSDKDVNQNEYIDNVIEDLNDNIDNIIDLTTGLHPEIKKLIAVPLSGIKYVIKDFDSNINKIKKNNDISFELETIDSNNIIVDIPEIFPKLQEIKINLPEILPIEIRIDKEYQDDLTNIFNDFYDKLKNIIDNYYKNSLLLLNSINIDLSDINKKDFKNVSDKNKYIHDFLIRCNIYKDQKQRLFSKIYNIDETISTLRACKVAKELKKRYEKYDYISNNVDNKIYKNFILQNSKIEYKNKYKKSLYNLYKYLNSTVILIDECLELNLSEIRSKIILIKEGEK